MEIYTPMLTILDVKLFFFDNVFFSMLCSSKVTFKIKLIVNSIFYKKRIEKNVVHYFAVITEKSKKKRHHHHNGCCVVVKKKVRSAIIINVLGTTTTTDVAARVLAMD